MIILAEISDKMISPWTVLMTSLPFALLGSSLGMVSRWLLIPVLALAAIPNRWMWEEDLQGQFGQTVIAEMGYGWIAASFCAWYAPFLICTVLVLSERQLSRRHRWAALHRCLRCGYDLRGNVSGICPECGKPISPVRTLDREEIGK